jgi:hypothetical protein
MCFILNLIVTLVTLFSKIYLKNVSLTKALMTITTMLVRHRTFQKTDVITSPIWFVMTHASNAGDTDRSGVL